MPRSDVVVENNAVSGPICIIETRVDTSTIKKTTVMPPTTLSVDERAEEAGRCAFKRAKQKVYRQEAKACRIKKKREDRLASQLFRKEAHEAAAKAYKTACALITDTTPADEAGRIRKEARAIERTTNATILAEKGLRPVSSSRNKPLRISTKARSSGETGERIRWSKDVQPTISTLTADQVRTVTSILTLVKRCKSLNGTISVDGAHASVAALFIHKDDSTKAYARATTPIGVKDNGNPKYAKCVYLHSTGVNRMIKRHIGQYKLGDRARSYIHHLVDIITDITCDTSREVAASTTIVPFDVSKALWHRGNLTFRAMVRPCNRGVYVPRITYPVTISKQNEMSPDDLVAGRHCVTDEYAPTLN